MGSQKLKFVVFALFIASAYAGGPSVQDCNIICPFNLDPVCGSNGEDLKTFPNECAMRLHNCETKEDFALFHKGKCTRNRCSNACPRIILPICVNLKGELKEFHNDCYLDIENCRAKGAYGNAEIILCIN